MEGLILLIVFVGFGLICLIAWGIAEITCRISNRKWEKWKNFCFTTYPELKVLLSEYSRLRKEHCETVKDALELQKNIDSWVEKNKYLPHGCRVDAHIEVLKENYQELLDIRAEQWELVEKAKTDLDNFWETNFPNLREDKKIMWLE
jgi:hypothetical protein